MTRRDSSETLDGEASPWHSLVLNVGEAFIRHDNAKARQDAAIQVNN